MALRATNTKRSRLYAGLSETERARMLAKLSRERNAAEMALLRDATPQAHAAAYNRALRLLRILNGNVLDWAMTFQISMERDRFRLGMAIRESAQRGLAHHRLRALWRLLTYPVTESEYRALVEMERAELQELDDYATLLCETASSKSGLNPQLAALLQNLPSDLKRERLGYEAWQKLKENDPAQAELHAREEGRRADAIIDRIRAVIDGAIKRGELPKPKRKDGELYLPTGVLCDWGEGTTAENYRPYPPAHFVPALKLFSGDKATWDIRPDSEADAVRERRAEMLPALLELAGAPRAEQAELATLDPPLSAAAHRKAVEHVDRLYTRWRQQDDVAELALAAAASHAASRSQLESLIEAIAILQREDFGGEDPLWTEVRAALEDGQTEAQRFEEEWAIANTMMLRIVLREALGLAPFPEDHIDEPAPLPADKPCVDEMLKLIRGWAEQA